MYYILGIPLFDGGPSKGPNGGSPSKGHPVDALLLS